MLAAAVLLVIGSLVAGVGLGRSIWPSPSATALRAATGGSDGSASSSGGVSGPSTGAGGPSGIAAIAAKVDPGLVDINTNLSYQDEQAAGTGMVLTPSGEVLTNNHVIDGATTISVTDIGNHKTYSAHVVGYDRTSDVAVIQLDGASGLATITPANSAPTVGEPVVGIGNAGGLGGTPSTAGGSVIALGQSITASDDDGGNSEKLSGLIETDAGIEPGDSGGSLVTTSGQVLGMDTAASASSGTGEGTQAYAIPIGTALSLAKAMESGKGSSTIHIGATAFLGLEIATSSSSSTGSGFGGSGGSGFGGDGGFGGFGNSGSSGNSGSVPTTSGADVSEVLPNSAAAGVGVAAGDVITSLGGTTVTQESDIANVLELHHPGDKISITWTDTSGQSHTSQMTLGSGPPT